MMDATLILIDSDGELVRAPRARRPALAFEKSFRRRSAGGASATDRCVRGKTMAPPAAERRRSDPPPHESAQSHASGPSPAPRHPKPRE